MYMESSTLRNLWDKL